MARQILWATEHAQTCTSSSVFIDIFLINTLSSLSISAPESLNKDCEEFLEVRVARWDPEFFGIWTWSKLIGNWYRSFLLQKTCSFVMCWNKPRFNIFWPITVAWYAVQPSYLTIHLIALRPTKQRGINLNRWNRILASTLPLILRARSFNLSISSFFGQFPAKSHAFLRADSHFCWTSSDGNEMSHFTSWLPNIVLILQSSVPLTWISYFDKSLEALAVVTAVTVLPECNRMLCSRPRNVPWRWVSEKMSIQLYTSKLLWFQVQNAIDYLNENKTVSPNILWPKRPFDVPDHITNIIYYCSWDMLQ